MKEHELKAGLYRHYKGGIYLMLGVGSHTETLEKYVVYVPLGVKDGPRIRVRPYEMFFEDVEFEGVKQPRFKYLGQEVTKEIAANYDPLSGLKNP